mgnify:CR=1 FL=1
MNKLLILTLVLVNVFCANLITKAYGTHTIKVANMMKSKIAQIAFWGMQNGVIVKDFSIGAIMPGANIQAILNKDPNAGIIAGTLGVSNGMDEYTLAFEDPFEDLVGTGVKGDIMEGFDSELALSQLVDSTTKVTPWGTYSFNISNGIRITSFEIRDPLF